MSLYKKFAQDDSIEKNGVWINYGGVRFLLARAGGSNEKFSKLLATRLKPYRHQIDTDSLAAEVAEDLIRGVYADTIILAWESEVDGKWVPYILDEAGNKLDFNPTNVRKVLTDLPELYNDIKKNAQNAALYRKHQEDLDAKN